MRMPNAGRHRAAAPATDGQLELVRGHTVLVSVIPQVHTHPLFRPIAAFCALPISLSTQGLSVISASGVSLTATKLLVRLTIEFRGRCAKLNKVRKDFVSSIMSVVRNHL